MRRVFVRRLLYPAQEILQGRDFLSLHEAWSRLQFHPADELRSRQEEKLRAICRHAAEHVPFYAARFKAGGLGPDDIRHLEDLPRLPILTREDVRRHFPEGMTADNVPRGRRILDRTSGSSGAPLAFFGDKAARDLVLAGFLLFNAWAGIRPGDRTTHIGAPRPLRPASRLSRALRGHTDLNAYDLNDRAASDMLDMLVRIKPALIEGFASSLFILAQTALRRGVRIRPRAVVTTSDTLPTVEPLRQAFGCPVFDRYGNREICGALAQGCGLSRGLHVNTELCVLEVVDARGLPVPAGARGRVLVTDLSNRVMPLLRLDTGDEAEAGGACDCGRGFPLIGGIEGRGSELLISPRGLRVSPAALGHYLFVVRPYAAHIRQFQAEQTRPERVTFRFVPLAAPGESLREELLSDLRRFLGGDIEVAVEWADDILPEPGGKRPIVKSTLSLPPAS